MEQKEKTSMITFRPANPSDLELTYSIKSSALRPYLQLIWRWDQSVQTQYYEYHKNHFNPHNIAIVLYEKRDIGYLETHSTADQLIIKNKVLYTRRISKQENWQLYT